MAAEGLVPPAGRRGGLTLCYIAHGMSPSTAFPSQSRLSIGVGSSMGGRPGSQVASLIGTQRRMDSDTMNMIAGRHGTNSVLAR